jgi:hypothetical protein
MRAGGKRGTYVFIYPTAEPAGNVSEGFFGEPYAHAYSRTSEFVGALRPLLDGAPAEIVGGLAAYAEAGATDLRLRVRGRTDGERRAPREFLTAALAAPR